MRFALQIVTTATVFSLSTAAAAGSASTQQFTVDCSAGKTITAALSAGDSRKPLLITVSGTCNEFVAITRDDVTLQGDPTTGGTVNAPGPTGSSITVQGARVTIDRLNVTGGTNGIFLRDASNALVTDCNVQSTAGNGIQVVAGNAIIQRSTVQSSGNHGVRVLYASVRVSNNQIIDNAGNGIEVFQGGGLNAIGNTIRANGGNGVRLYMGSSGSITGNTISDNGTDPITRNEKNGILISYSKASIVNNTITGNPWHGVKGHAAGVDMFTNTVTNNGSGGVWTLGTFLGMSGDTVSGNQGIGVSLGVHSTGYVVGATIENNAWSGIFLQQGSKLIVVPPQTSVNGNWPWGLDCAGSETSVDGIWFLSGSVNPACTGF